MQNTVVNIDEHTGTSDGKGKRRSSDTDEEWNKDEELEEKGFLKQGGVDPRNRYKCERRGQGFCNTPTLRDHLTLIHQKGEEVEEEEKELRFWTCKTCNTAYKSKTCFLKHVSSQACPHRCQECGRVYAKKSLLRDHIDAKHKKIKKFLCCKCDYRASTKQQVDNHVRDVHEDFRVECPTCHARVRNRCLLRHLRTHTGEKPYKCQQCTARFCKKGNLLVHQAVHSKTREHLCHICGKEFSFALTLKKHMFTHGDRKFPCEICNQKFKSPASLKAHYLTHTKEPRHPLRQCDKCGKTFKTPWSLTLHLRIHNNENPYSCVFCGKKFYNPWNHKVHLRIHK